jgi:signal transduction histidine kinase
MINLGKLRSIAFAAVVGMLLGIIAWTESHVWSQIDRMRATKGAITQDDIASLHRLQTWSSVVLLAVGGSLAVLVYRGLVAPLQARLRQSQLVIERQEKLSSLGVLAAGVAHEIRNPLTSIKVRLFTQQQLLRPGSEEHEDNVFLTGEISRLEKIVRDFLAFARPSEPAFEVIRATQPLRELRPLLQPPLRAQGVALQEEYLADPLIRADAAQLKQVLINLVKNAGESMSGPGTVTLRTRTERRGLGARGATLVVLEVADTGPGIAPDVARRLFDPFFTTKPSGTGLGLSIAARIIENHQGTLEFSTEANRGTAFRILLPIESSHDSPEDPGH